MPMIPEAAYAMLACARLGAVHSVVFGGFSPDSLANRIEDCKSNVVITADEGVRGGKKIPLKANTDAAIAKVGGVDHVIVVKRTGGKVDWDPVRDVWYHARPATQVVTCGMPVRGDERGRPAVHLCYTLGLDRQAGEGSVLHTTGGYHGLHVDHASIRVLDYHDGDIYWCTADVGWVTGHSYILYGPPANGATTLDVSTACRTIQACRVFLDDVCDKQQVMTILLHRADRDPRALMQAPVKARSEGRFTQGGACPARLDRRADQSRSVGDGIHQRRLATAAARSSIRGGRPRPAAS